MTEARISGSDAERGAGGRWAPGNRGKRPGTRNRATRVLEVALDKGAKGISAKLIEMALAGDPTCLRLAVDRLAPIKRERTVSIALPELRTAADHAPAVAAVISAVASGELAPGEAEAIVGMLGEHRRAVADADFDARLRELEAKLQPK
jgi:hypothetical protein